VNLLAIESSCDETAAAVVRDGRELLSSHVSSQIALHTPYGGVVPELAARAHLEMLAPVVDAALAGVEGGWEAVDAIAVTLAPEGRYVGVAPLGTALTDDQAAQLHHLGHRQPVVATDAAISVQHFDVTIPSLPIGVAACAHSPSATTFTFNANASSQETEASSHVTK